MTKHSPQRIPQDPNRFWIWGKHACNAALHNPKRKCFKLLVTEGMKKELSLRQETFTCAQEIIEGASLSRLLPEGAVHQGIAMEVAPLAEPSSHLLSTPQKGVLVVLDQITDPQNVGAILRTARAFKALGVLMTDRHAPSLNGVLAKTASGALETVPVWKVTNLARTLDEMKAMGFWIVGLDEKGEKSLSRSNLPDKLVLIMGAEGEGLRRLTQEKCDFLVNLPTDPEFPTLNVSVATAIALYELLGSAQ